MLALRTFRKDQRGNFATIFALTMVPICGIVGAAVDYSRASEVHAKLSEALDAGVLAVGSQPKMSDADAYKIVNDCSLPYTGRAVVQRIITDLCVLDITDDGLKLVELAPGVTEDEVRDKTQPEIIAG